MAFLWVTATQPGSAIVNLKSTIMFKGNILIDGKEITPCELAIIKLVMRELSRKEIAAELDKSEDTIDSQMRLLFRKVGVKKANGLAAWAALNHFDRLGNYIPVAAKPQTAPHKRK